MRRPGIWLLAALALALTGSAAGSAAAGSFSAVQASAREYSIALSRGRIAPGKLRLEFANFGEDDHDLAFRRIGSSAVRNLGVTRPGRRSVGRFNVRRGSYLLWCTLADHRARGMSARLAVR
jgi:hypothetical protein